MGVAESLDVPLRRNAVRLVHFLAWGVHLYTALGLVLAALIAVLLVQGGIAAFRWSFLLMVVATLIDATDGTLARKVGVKKVLPNFDGRKLDDITDFLTYTFLPLLLIWRAELLPAGTEGWLVLPLLASAYGFCQVSAKTDDGFFLGFPSLWNVVALYLYVLHLPGWLSLGIVIVLGLMTFVPSLYLYPVAAGLAQPAEQHPGRGLDRPAAGDLLAAADRPRPAGRRPVAEPRARLPLLPRLLHDHVVVDHAQALVQGPVPSGARPRPTSARHAAGMTSGSAALAARWPSSTSTP
jgi:phosphatidylcholine synthase